MNCPYCNSPKRTETTYECCRRTDMDEFQRPEKCLRNEIGLLNEHIKRLIEAGDELQHDNDDMEILNKWWRAKKNKL